MTPEQRRALQLNFAMLLAGAAAIAVMLVRDQGRGDDGRDDGPPRLPPPAPDGGVLALELDQLAALEAPIAATVARRRGVKMDHMGGRDAEG